jgi:hypothetical protein
MLDAERGMTTISNSSSALAGGTSGLILSGIARSAGAASTTTDSPARDAVSIELSDQAKALLQQTTEALMLSFDEMLQKRTDVLTGRLTDAFKKLNVNLDDAVRLKVDKYGKVTTEGPWKEKIEKLFADDPELAKEFKTIAALNSLKAAQTALDLYNKEKGGMPGSDRQSDAWTRYNIRSINIQALSGVISLKDGQLRSAAIDYIDMIADPTGAKAISQKDAANRLA